MRVVGDWLERELAWAQDEGPGGVCGWVCGGAGGAGGSVCGRCIRKVFWLLVALPQGLPDPRGCRWGWRGRDAGAHQQTSEVGRLDVGVDERVMGLGSQVVMLCGRARARLVSRASQPGKPAAGGRPGGGCLASRGEALAVAEVDVLREAAKCVMQEVGGFGGGGGGGGLRRRKSKGLPAVWAMYPANHQHAQQPQTPARTAAKPPSLTTGNTSSSVGDAAGATCPPADPDTRPGCCVDDGTAHIVDARAFGGIADDGARTGLSTKAARQSKASTPPPNSPPPLIGLGPGAWACEAGRLCPRAILSHANRVVTLRGECTAVLDPCSGQRGIAEGGLGGWLSCEREAGCRYYVALVAVSVNTHAHTHTHTLVLSVCLSVCLSLCLSVSLSRARACPLSHAHAHTGTMSRCSQWTSTAKIRSWAWWAKMTPCFPRSTGVFVCVCVCARALMCACICECNVNVFITGTCQTSGMVCAEAPTEDAGPACRRHARAAAWWLGSIVSATFRKARSLPCPCDPFFFARAFASPAAPPAAAARGGRQHGQATNLGRR